MGMMGECFKMNLMIFLMKKMFLGCSALRFSYNIEFI